MRYGAVSSGGKIIMNMGNLRFKLKLLDERHKQNRKDNYHGLSVYYGWAKINKTRKKEAISVIYENCNIPPRSQGFVSKMQNIVYVRKQTPEESNDAKGSNRSFTEYSIFLNDKRCKGSLELALKENYLDDRKNVSEAERNLIRNKLREAFMESHPDYKEPVIQLELDFENYERY